MRLVFLSRYPPSECGIAEYTDMLARSLLGRRGDLNDLVVVGNYDIPSSSTYRDPEDLKVHRCFRSGAVDYNELYRCLKTVLSAGDILHIQHEYSIFPSNNEFLSLLIELKKRIKDLKIAVTLHTVRRAVYAGSLNTPKHLVESIDFQTALSRVADAIIVHHPHMEMELWFQGVNPEKIRIIPHGTPINPLSNESRRELANLLNVDLPSQSFIIGTPGFIRWDKGLDILLESFNSISGKYDATLVIIGTHQGYEGLKLYESIQNRLSGRSNIIVIKTYLDRRRFFAYIRLLDLAVFPYREDIGHIGISGALHAAMGSFIPMICAQVPRLIECYVGTPDLTIPPESPGRLASKLEWAINNYNEALIISERLWSYGIDTMWQIVARKHLEIYEDL